MKKYIYKSIGLLMAVTLFTSCLKDDRLVLDPSKTSNVIEFENPAEIQVHGSTTALYSLAFPITTTATIIPIKISYSGAEDAAPEDIVVNFGVGSQAAIDQYNTEQGKSMIMMPSSTYTLSATSVTIPKGQKTATFNISTFTNTYNLSQSYALPLTITSVSKGTISKNFSTIIMNLVAKNKYDGVYRVTNLNFQNTTAAAHTAGTPRTRHLITRSATENHLGDPGLAAVYGIYFLNAGAGSYYGNFSPVFKFDETTNNVLSVSNYYPVPNASNRDAKLDPTGVNKFTFSGDNKKMEVSYIMTVNGVNTLFLKEEWVYTGSR